MKEKKYPRLLHIGTQKAASTYLYNLLDKHPEISLHHLTEVNYFSSNFDKGLDWYLKNFKGDKKQIDTSPKYFMLGKDVAPRIKAYTEENQIAKPLFLLILRNPIDYLNSHFEMQKHHDFFKKHPETYPETPDNLIEFAKKYPHYLERGFYYKILNNYWLSTFSQEQFKIITFEKFIKNKKESLKEILSFWQLPLLELSSSEVSKNRLLKYKCLKKLQSKIIKNQKLKTWLKNNSFFNFIYDNFLTAKSTQKLSEEERKYLKEIFQTDVKNLEKLLQRKIIEWSDFN